MDVLQGRYLKKVNSKRGELKGLKIKTKDGVQTVHLPKALRTIALHELTLGDALRVWTTQRKQGKKAKIGNGGKSSQSLQALQLIPLSPKSEVALDELTDNLNSVAPSPSKSQLEKAYSKKVKPPKKRKKSKKRKAAKRVTVQLCQKKNCCKKGGTQLWSAFESAKDTASVKPFKLEAVGCLGGCKRGPNIRFLPDNVKHYHVQPKDVGDLLAKYGAR